jgi:hypothetical protein
VNEIRIYLQAPLEKLGYSSLTDLFIDQPTLNFFTAAQRLSTEKEKLAPVQVGNALKEECEQRGDIHFFARVALFTTFTGFEAEGWTKNHWMRFGRWGGMLGSDSEEAASRSWDYLKGLELAEGWQPESIFDPILEEAVKRGFGSTT